ncbi:MAG: esterase-like activity of phytase family protein [Bacteriovorax sp.]
MKRHLSIALYTGSIFLSQNAFAKDKLRFIGDQNISTGEKFKETEIGGLSGLLYDKENNKILAISDDKSVVNDARFYEFDLKLDEKSFKVTPSEVVILKNKEGRPFKKGTVDFEGITLYNGDIIASSEGALNKEPPINPEIIQFSRQGSYKGNLDVPEQFLVRKGESKYGARENLAFEALSASKDGKTLWVGMEEALLQDDRTSTPTYASIVRIIQYKDLKPTKEFAYKLEKVPSVKVAGLTVGETGLSEILAIDDKNFYSLERSYLPLAKKLIIRIFKNSVNDKTTDISKMDSINKKDIKLVDKELVADLEEFKDQMTANFQSLDNIEGLCFGPTLPNGHETIILVSDNNFKKSQRTQFLAFEIVP